MVWGLSPQLLPQWQTSLKEIVSLNPIQTVLPAGDQVFKPDPMAGILIQVFTVWLSSDKKGDKFWVEEALSMFWSLDWRRIWKHYLILLYKYKMKLNELQRTRLPWFLRSRIMSWQTEAEFILSVEKCKLYCKTKKNIQLKNKRRALSPVIRYNKKNKGE